MDYKFVDYRLWDNLGLSQITDYLLKHYFVYSRTTLFKKKLNFFLQIAPNKVCSKSPFTSFENVS